MRHPQTKKLPHDDINVDYSLHSLNSASNFQITQAEELTKESSYPTFPMPSTTWKNHSERLFTMSSNPPLCFYVGFHCNHFRKEAMCLYLLNFQRTVLSYYVPHIFPFHSKYPCRLNIFSSILRCI